MQMSFRESTTLDIGGVAVAIDWDGSLGPLSSDGLYDNFVSGNAPEVSLTIHHGFPPISSPPGELLFDSQSHWKLFKTNGRSVVTLESPLEAQAPYCVAIFDGRFRHGDVYRVGPTWSDTGLKSDAPGALDHTLMQILTLSFMSLGRGMMVHACGVEHNGRGYLFAGNSGHGKSTIAGLWRNQGLVLNDDRIVLRRREGVIQMYGTPWHGDHKSGSGRGVPLEECFFLRRGESNKAFAVKKAQACSMLLARSFPPLWDEEAMTFTLDFMGALVSEVRTYELTFVPTEDVVDFILCRI
jgi:hypothetical protein